jgi:DNA-binding MurR/RpiR family transcriptional regulator
MHQESYMAALEALSRDPQATTLIRLRGIYPSLKTALQKVADMVMQQPMVAVYASVNEVAAVSGVSEGTVMRLCRTLGFKGFQDFKIALAQEMAALTPSRPPEPPAPDDPQAIVRQVFQANMAALQGTLDILNAAAVQDAARVLAASRRVLVVGVAGSAPMVTYAGQRFFLLGLDLHCYTDGYQVLKAASLSVPDDAILAISHSGGAREVVDAARLSQEAGAKVVAITSDPLSPLGRLADLALITVAPESRLQENGQGPFLSQTSLIDALYTLIYRARPERVRENLAKMARVAPNKASKTGMTG